MALNPKYSTELVNAQADAMARLLDGGMLKIYSGSQPANANAAITGTLLATATFNATSAPAASGGLLTFNAFTPDTSIDATGTASHFRAFKANGTSPIFDGSVGTSSADLIVNSVAFQSGAQFSVTSFTHQVSLG